MRPRAVFGAPLYNAARTLPEALESLLSQTESALAVVLVDDCSSDATPDIVRSYADLDERVVYRRNERRLGLVGNWRRAFDLATELFPEAPYFAWASDHDVWHPRWLAAVMRELERSPGTVLAFTSSERIDSAGSPLYLRPRPVYDSRGVEEPRERLRHALEGLAAGDAVYGLARVTALRRAGPFPYVLQPDRLLVRTLAVHGHVVQLPETLWYRRVGSPDGQVQRVLTPKGRERRVVSVYSRRRQRASLFVDRVPLHAYLPASLVHSGLMAWDLGYRGSAGPRVSRPHGLALAATYLGHSAALVATLTVVKRRQRAGKWVVRRRERLEKARGAGVKRLRRSVRRLRQFAGRLAGRG